MLRRGVILLGVLILLFSLDVDALSLCQGVGGRCYYDHELNNYRCPNDVPRMISGLEGERLCIGHEDDALGVGASVVDITGLEVEGINCCLPPRGGGGGPRCGDGTINREAEECDGNDFNGQECSDLGNFNTGQLSCRNDCTIDTSDCSYQNEVNLILDIQTQDDWMCPEEDAKWVRITLQNDGDPVEDVYIYDTLYFRFRGEDGQCVGEGSVYWDYRRVEHSCGNLDNGESCIWTRDILFDFPGCYYHNIFVSSGDMEGFLQG